ncbi:MAG TPA: OmpA family protein [Gammaproteobacteria bacterium]|nr:OmpA family protein [Gammaproteobacteria bacterium]
MSLRVIIAAPVALLIIAGCNSLPDRVDTVEQARESIAALEREPLAGRVASREINAARDALAEADDAYEEGQSLEIIEHNAYIAQRYADISRELVAEASAREEITRGEAERNRIIAEARERDAQAAEREAEAANRELEVQSRAAEEQGRAAQAAEERSRELERELEDLEARNTEDRGLVLTLGDVLFDTGTATLKPGAATTVDRLAQFMRDYPERSVRIEGHTDAAGSDETNQALSERRAQAVRDALVMRGLPAERIGTMGYGEARPIAGNDSPGGRQQNRRVEIVVSDAQGAFAEDSRRKLL